LKLHIQFITQNFINGSKENPSPDALQKAAQDIQKDIEGKLTKTTNGRGQTIIIGVVFETPIEVCPLPPKLVQFESIKNINF